MEASFLGTRRGGIVISAGSGEALGVGGVVLDIDGVLWLEDAPTPGSTAFLDTLGADATPFVLLTNTCISTAAERWEELTARGFALRQDQLLTAGVLTGSWLQKANVRTIMYLGAPSVLPDMVGRARVCDEGPVDAVVVGDMFAHYDRQALEMAARAVCDGAILVAMQRNPRWSDGKTWYVDNGFWVAGLEYATGREALIMGKPSPEAYVTAIAALGVPVLRPSDVAFVSDDIASDLRGAKDAGLTTVYFGPDQMLPEWVDDSASDMSMLAALLGKAR